MKGYTNIPVSLMIYALVNRKANHLKLYVHLKLNCNGYIEYNKASSKLWAKEIGVNEKTIDNCLKWLFKEKWITGNCKRGVIRIISYRRLTYKLELSLNTGHIYDPKDYSNFKSLCCGVTVTYILFKKRYFDKQSGSIKGLPTTNCKQNKGFYPMSNCYLASSIGVSIATACRYKQEAEKAGYIVTKDNLVTILSEDGKKVTLEHYSALLMQMRYNGVPNRLRKGKKYLKWVEADLIISCLKCKKKKYESKRKK